MTKSPSGTPQRKAESAQLRARRSPKLVALGALSVVLGALAAFAVYTMSVATVPVVTVTKDLTRGHRIAVSDLAVVDVPKGLAPHSTPGDQLQSFVGSTALSDLPRGSFPTRTHVGTPVIPEGHRLMGLRLETGRIPATPLVPGTKVLLIDTQTRQTYPAQLASAPVSDQHTGFHTVDVTLPASSAPEVAAHAAQEHLVLVVEAGD